MPEIIYDAELQWFYAVGDIDSVAFMEALWEQWDSDYVGWYEEDVKYDMSRNVTFLLGCIVHLGPELCDECGRLMSLKWREITVEQELEFWFCRKCKLGYYIKERLL